MYKVNKQRIYIADLIDDITISTPTYYLVSNYLSKNENFLYTLKALHSYKFDNFYYPKSFEDLFKYLKSKYFAIYKEKYILGLFKGKLMYLESNGWKSLTPIEDIFKLENYLIN